MRSRAPAPRGNTLIIAMIMLTVLSIIGVAAVSLSTQERRNAGAAKEQDAAVLCANAAQAKLWAEISARGTGYLSKTNTMTVTSIKLIDGRQLWAPAHFGSTTTTPVGSGVGTGSAGSSTGLATDVNVSNTMLGGTGSGAGTWFTARCVDDNGREHEVEFGFRFAL